MVIFDTNGEVVETYDPELGHLVDEELHVVHMCLSDGTIVTTHLSGEPIENYDGHIPGNMIPDDCVMGRWPVKIYIPYTEEELMERRITSQTAVAVQMLVVEADLPDEKALQVEALYPEWEVGVGYELKDICRYQDELYRCIFANTSQAEHTPDISVAQWKKILPAEEPGGYLPWVQPLGYSDAYNIGDRVTHNDKVWESTVDGNVWEPGVYGWDEVIV